MLGLAVARSAIRFTAEMNAALFTLQKVHELVHDRTLSPKRLDTGKADLMSKP
jgi:hypothetical protein